MLVHRCFVYEIHMAAHKEALGIKLLHIYETLHREKHQNQMRGPSVLYGSGVIGASEKR